jgi:lipid-A-disaccharide synthase
MEALRLAFVAGEASGDLLAAPVIAALRQRSASIAAGGIAGDRMIAAGCEPWHHVRELSVRGYAEVLRELPRLLALRRALRERILRERPAALVGVDAPDFNLRLETQVRLAGVPTVHYVSPSIWAWRRNRIEKIRRAASHVLLVFPFEEAIYREASIAATYVGHPLASSIDGDADPQAARRSLGLAEQGTVVALLPGSRRAEIEHIAPLLLDAAVLLLARDAGARFVLPAADQALRARLESMLADRPELAGRLQLVAGRSHECLQAADGVLVASGTATLEAALFRKPMVIVYRMPRLSWWIMGGMGYLPWIGLPNILAREFVVPELLQDAATPGALADAISRQLADDALKLRLKARFAEMHAQLRRDTPRLAAEAILATAARRLG